METIEHKSLKELDGQLGKDALRRQRDDDLRDDDMISNPQIADSRLPGWDNADEDDDTLVDNETKGRDLDTDNGDEWDEENMDTDLDNTDLDDDDEINHDIHGVKNDRFGSLGRSITSETEPNPDEIPEEHEVEHEVDIPDDDRMEEAKDDEVTYKEPKEVVQPDTKDGEPKNSTLGDVDSTFTDQSHGRTSGRMIDHEPAAGTTPPEHGAYNL